jgi:hypothetical protein
MIREIVGNDCPGTLEPVKIALILMITEWENETKARISMIHLLFCDDDIDNCLEKREKPNIVESYGLYRKLKKPKV